MEEVKLKIVLENARIYIEKVKFREE